MRKQEEKVLLYQFTEDAVRTIKEVLRKLGIQTVVLGQSDRHQRVGFLLAMKGFRPNTAEEEPFDFAHEAAVFHNIKGKRLDQVLQAMKDADVAHVRFKAVTTPFNVHWTLDRLCKTMYKEHAYMAEKKEKIRHEV